jgi:hypothetical protein
MTDKASLPGRLIRVKNPVSSSTPDELYAVALDDDDLALNLFKASYLGRPENIELIGDLSASTIIGLALKPSALAYDNMQKRSPSTPDLSAAPLLRT